MKRHQTVAVVILLATAVAAFVAYFLAGHSVPVLQPEGTIARKQLNLMIVATLLMLIVVVPVFVLTFGIAWRYRAGNTKATYKPDWDHNRWAEATWWLVPFTIIAILAVITWQSSHDLDPYKALESTKKPLRVQVVALQWRWLFIYPDQHVASVNRLEFPEDTPIDLQITSDAPMNSFWVPQLAGQVYAMSGMSTQLHLASDHAETYQGVSANLSGDGFAGMRFTANATSQADFDRWVKAQQSAPALTTAEYNNLAKPSHDSNTKSYTAPESDLYDRIIMKYMMPAAESDNHGVSAQ
jgi:cytochrome o ubiquinol oxidase subunit 2